MLFLKKYIYSKYIYIYFHRYFYDILTVISIIFSYYKIVIII